MNKNRKRKLAAGAVAGLAVAGGGGAIAATQLGSPGAESQAVVSDAAKELGVQPSALSHALKKALKNRVDAAVGAGRLTKAEGDAIKARIDSGDFPLFFGVPGRPHAFGHFRHFGFADLSVAASFLDLTTAQLDEQLDSGKTLAQIAKEKAKSVDELVNKLYDASKKKLDAAVAAGRLTKDDEQEILSDVKQRITDFVNGVRLRPDPGHDGGFGFGFRRRSEFNPPPRLFGNAA